jgi:spore germination protein YaaH
MRLLPQSTGVHTLLLFALVLGLGTVASPPANAQTQTERLFYYVDRPVSYNRLTEHIDQISVVAPAAYSVDEDGVVWGTVDPRVRELAAANDVAVMPLVKNPGFDQELLHTLLQDSTARRRAIESMVEQCERYGYVGFQFDFENIHIDDRAAYTQFYREAARVLHEAGYQISMAVVHRPAEFAGPTQYHKWLFKNWRAGYDLEALAEIGDFISVMTYAQHTRRMPPGPQAGLPWVRRVVEYFLRFMPPEKLSLGIPTGSQRWYTSQEDQIKPEMARSYSEQLSYEEAMGYVERYDAPVTWSERHKVPYTFYSNAGAFEWIFMENARSFRAKLGLVDEYELRGFSVWVLGNGDPDLWEVLAERE